MYDPIAAKDAELRQARPADPSFDEEALRVLSEAWQRLDGYEPGLRALIEGAFARAHFRAERLDSQRVATERGVATIVAYMAHRDDLALPLVYHLVGTLSWEPAREGDDGRFALDWNEATLRYGDSERHVSFPAAIESDGSPSVNGKAFADAVAIAMG